MVKPLWKVTYKIITVRDLNKTHLGALQREHHDNEVTCEARNNNKIAPLAKSVKIQMICKPHIIYPSVNWVIELLHTVFTIIILAAINFVLF